MMSKAGHVAWGLTELGGWVFEDGDGGAAAKEGGGMKISMLIKLSRLLAFKALG